MESTKRAVSRDLDPPVSAGIFGLGHGFALDAEEVRPMGLLAAVCAVAVAVVMAVYVMLAPHEDLSGLIVMTGAAAAALLVAAAAVGKRRTAHGLDIAGMALMLLGIAAGALSPDGLGAAAILPLGGAVLTLPNERGRPLATMFLLAFAAGMTGETAAYLVGGMATVVGPANVPRSLVESGVGLGFIYGLVWWVGDRWWAATASAQHALTSQRRLLEVNERLLSTLEPEGVLSLIADSLKSVVNYDNLTIYRVDRTTGLLRPVVARDRFAQLIMGTTLQPTVGITGWVVAHAEAQCVNDSRSDPRVAIIPGTPDEPESLIVVPLLVRGQVAGTLNLGRMGRSEAHFTPAEFEMARLFAGQASIALQNAETHRAVTDRAETDSLTGLQNRGAFDERLEALVGNPAAQPCALVMVDLDGLHGYNNRHGHPAGDTALQAIGKVIKTAVRDGDGAFRYGGDEFAVLLPRTEESKAVSVAERIRRAIADLDAGTPTASLGVACTSDLDAAPIELLIAADRALLRAKASGGNRIEMGDEVSAA
jgi:diguanylate cyclase (GGDEF)-like protein